jgi:hypothetical protein
VTLKTSDIVACIVIVVIFAPVGVWVIVNPCGAARYFLRDRLRDHPEVDLRDKGVQLAMKLIGAFFIVIPLVCLFNLLARTFR